MLSIFGSNDMVITRWLVSALANLSLLAVATFAKIGHSETAQEFNKSPVEWAKSIRASQRLRALRVPTRVAIVKKVGKTYQAVSFRTEETSSSFLEVAPFEQSQLTFEINKAEGKSKCSTSAATVVQCLGVDLLLDTTKDKWLLLYYDKSRKGIKVLAKDTGSGDSQFVKWILAKLNYDGVILDQEGPYRLALVAPNVVAGQSQVLALGNTAKKATVDAAESKGSGLLLVKKIEGRFAILELVLAGDEGKFQTKPGDKIILETAEKAEKSSLSKQVPPKAAGPEDEGAAPAKNESGGSNSATPSE